MFCAPDLSLNSKIMNHCNIKSTFMDIKRGQNLHFIGTLDTDLFSFCKEET